MLLVKPVSLHLIIILAHLLLCCQMMCEEQMNSEVSNDILSGETEDHPVRERSRYALTQYYTVNGFCLDFEWNAYIYCN